MKPRVLGVAFGGGGVRGVMHLGVIKALIEEGITPDLVTGTSAGSIAAVMFASGMGYTDMENILLNVSSSDLADVVISSKGLINGQKLSDWVNQHVNQTELDSMPIPVGITATNLNTLGPIVM
ncbi:patatin-like phospholipase family protein [Photobacterium damselae]|uniref:patatin-like phospholipase family protein n=1 Tax=Photobacterium damselae TaxID=38293 RepID=UPI002F423101